MTAHARPMPIDPLTITSPLSEIIVSCVTLLGVLFNGTLVYLTRRSTNAINDAVNHRHTGDKRILDLVRDTAEEVSTIAERQREATVSLNALQAWRRHWEALPPELSSDDGLVRAFERIDNKVERVSSEVAQVQRTLHDHVSWEMEKYEALASQLTRWKG